VPLPASHMAPMIVGAGNLPAPTPRRIILFNPLLWMVFCVTVLETVVARRQRRFSYLVPLPVVAVWLLQPRPQILLTNARPIP